MAKIKLSHCATQHLKGLLAFIAALFSMTTAPAQSSYIRIDTSFVIYQQFDWDAWVMANPRERVKEATNAVVMGFQDALGYHDVLQYNYAAPPEGFNVVGLACHDWYDHHHFYPMDPPEFLLLYDAKTDTLEFKNQLQWDLTDTFMRPIRNPMVSAPYACEYDHFQTTTNDDMLGGLRLLTYYFDKPINVHDSFYVGSTAHQAQRLYTGEPYSPISWGNIETLKSAYKIVNPVTMQRVIDSSCAPPPTRWIVWDHRSHESDSIGWRYYDQFNYLMVMPIIEVYDTTYEMPPCPMVAGTMARGNYSDTVTIQWNFDSLHPNYEVCWGPRGTQPGAGAIVTVANDNKWSFYDTAYKDVQMVSYVRTICTDYDTLRQSNWSSPLYWTLHQWNNGINDDGSDIAQSTAITPNPASGSATVSSAFRMERIEAYNTAGVKVLDQAASGLRTDIDLADWAKGAYVVITRTSSGTAAKRLVVQ